MNMPNMCAAKGSRILKSWKALQILFQRSFKSEETIWFAFFDFRCSIKASNYQAKFKHVAGTFLREISINFIVNGQRQWGRVIGIPPRGKKVPEGEDMLAFYKQML